VALLLRWLDLSLASDAWNLLTAEVGRSVGQEVGRLGESEIDRRVQVGWYAKEEGALAFALCDKCEAQVCQPLSLSLLKFGLIETRAIDALVTRPCSCLTGEMAIWVSLVGQKDTQTAQTWFGRAIPRTPPQAMKGQ